MWSLRPGSIETNGPVTSASFISHGTNPLIITGSYDGTLMIARAEPLPSASCLGQKAFLEGHTGPVYSAEWSPKNFSVVSAGADGVFLWDATAAKMTNSFKEHSGYYLSFSSFSSFTFFFFFFSFFLSFFVIFVIFII